MSSEYDPALAKETVKQFRMCGHYLYYKMGDKGGRRRILVALTEHGALLQKELQEMLGIQSGTISEAIIKMEADGLVEKLRCEKDGRNFIVRLTPEGRAEAKSQMAEYNVRVEQLMSCFSEEQLETLHDLLGIMLEHWKKNERDWDCLAVQDRKKAKK